VEWQWLGAHWWCRNYFLKLKQLQTIAGKVFWDLRRYLLYRRNISANDCNKFSWPARAQDFAPWHGAAAVACKYVSF
jgi:hypothetical protein